MPRAQRTTEAAGGGVRAAQVGMKLGTELHTRNVKDTQALIMRWDTSGDGSIDKKEFRRALLRDFPLEGATAEEARGYAHYMRACTPAHAHYVPMPLPLPYPRCSWDAMAHAHVPTCHGCRRWIGSSTTLTTITAASSTWRSCRCIAFARPIHAPVCMCTLLLNVGVWAWVWGGHWLMN